MKNITSSKNIGPKSLSLDEALESTTATKKRRLVKKKRKVNIKEQKEFTGPKETVEEFLARGGEITICPAVRGPGELPGDPPRRLLDTTGWYS